MNLIHKILDDLYVEYKNKPNHGALANYIPQLSLVNPANLGITVTTVDGYQYSFGDMDCFFTIQSVSKPFIYGMALQEHGVEDVMKRISVEPSGEAFNSISLYANSGRPYNPMINAGAIAATGLVWDIYQEQSFNQIMKVFGAYAGSALTIDYDVYNSENETGHRNRAIAHLLRNFNILSSVVDGPLETYFKQCSINVSCAQLSVMGATLANNGINPITGANVLHLEYVPKVLSVMSSCGMYDYSGEWIYNVGLPAKSGVGGGVVAVLPGQLSVAVYSPLLDAKGNSVFGVEICKRIAEKFSLHLYKTPSLSQRVVRKHTTLETTRSKYKRDNNAEEIFKNHGGTTSVLELQGDLGFATCEIFMRRIPTSCLTLIISLQKCDKIDDAALALLLELNEDFGSQGKTLYICNFRHITHLSIEAVKLHSCFQFELLDEALLQSENELLDQHQYSRIKTPVILEKQQLLMELDELERSELSKYLLRKTYKKGDVIISKGRKAKHIYFLESGEVSIMGSTEDNRQFVLSVLSAGNSFGEMALIENTVRSADVLAQTDVTCSLMPYGSLDQNSILVGIKSKILANIAVSLSGRLRTTNQEIAGFN